MSHWSLQKVSGALGDELREEYESREAWERDFNDRAFAWLWEVYGVAPGDMVRMRGEAQGRIVLRRIVDGRFRFAGCSKTGRMYENSSGFGYLSIGEEGAAIVPVMRHADRDQTHDNFARKHEHSYMRDSVVPVVELRVESTFPERDNGVRHE